MSVIKITSENFDQEVINSSVPVILDFWATWCGPCQMLSPIVDKYAEDNEGKIKVGKVNVDDEFELSRQYGIVSIPTLILFKDGEEKAKSIGLINESELRDFVNNN